MKQAPGYLDGLAVRAEDTAKAPWPTQIPCPVCGAPVYRLAVDYRPEEGHAVLHRHPDGTVCEAESTKK